MIIKVVRGSYFGGVVDYVTRSGKYAGKGDAIVLQSRGLYGYKTFAAQLAYDAARAPTRSRPVVHLIARAERTLTLEQFADLGDRMLRVAGLEGHAHIKVVHDEPDDDKEGGHLHVVVGEVDDEGNAPPRIFYDKVNKRPVTAEEARDLPKGAVMTRAWDSHLAWRLTRLAREVEVEWGLRQLSSTRAAKNLHEPQIDRGQQEHLARTGLIPLQDRFFEEVRAALVLPTWDRRAEALAEHGLVLRPFETKGRVRGLMVHSINNKKDAVKVSAFNLGGMEKLDASADMAFVAWHPEYRAAINLRKTDKEAKTDHWRATQRRFYLHLQDWRAIKKRRDRAHSRYKQDRVRVMAKFERQIADEPAKALHRSIRSERSDELVRIKAERNFALAEAGPQGPRPNFADYVVKLAGEGDAAAAKVQQDLLSKVTQTRRIEIDRHKARIAALAAATHALRTEAIRLRSHLSGLAAELRDEITPARQEAVRLRKAAAERTRQTMVEIRIAASRLAAQLADALDRANQRIRIRKGRVDVDSYQPNSAERALLEHEAHLPIFACVAYRQSGEVDALRLAVVEHNANAAGSGPVQIDMGRVPLTMLTNQRWADQPEITAELVKLDADRRTKAREAIERENARLEQQRSMSAALVRSSVRRPNTTVGKGARETLLAAAAPNPGDSRATRVYLSAWQSALTMTAPGTAFDAAMLRTIEINAIAALAKHEARYEEAVILRLVRERSPANAIVADGTSDAGTRAQQILAFALERPDIKSRIEDNRAIAAIVVEKADHAAVIDSMERKAKNALSQHSRWVALYDEILTERPVNFDMQGRDLYATIDHEVAALMLRGGFSWTQVRTTMASLSPISQLADDGDGAQLAVDPRPEGEGRTFARYVSGQMASLDYVVDSLPVALQAKVERERKSLAGQVARLAEMISDQDGPGNFRQSIPDMLPSLASLTPEERRMIHLAPASPEAPARPLPITSDNGAVDKELRHLNDLRDNPTDYRIGGNGLLIAPGRPEAHQKALALLQRDELARRKLEAARLAGVARAVTKPRTVPPRDGLER
ncbi:MAG: hypothetical protein ACSLE1_21120 [Sphingobium sp.]